MKTFKVRCRGQGQQASLQIHIGQPAPGFHPLKYQAAWLRETQQKEMDPKVMQVFEELQAIAQEQGGSFETLCEEVIL